MVFKVWCGPVLAGVIAVVAGGCSTSKLTDLDGPQYSGGAARAAATPYVPPRERAAPVFSVERSVEPPVRHVEGEARDGPFNGDVDYQLGQARRSSEQEGRGFETARKDSTQDVAASPERRRPVYRRRGVARWMGQSWVGRRTTIQEPFDPDRLTGAHASLPLPSYLYVTNRANGRTVLIRVNDRPASGLGRNDEPVVLVSRRVADLLDFSRKGSTKVELQYAGAAGLVSSGRHEEAFLRRQPWYARTTDRVSLNRPLLGRQARPSRQWADFQRSTRSGLTR